jgi:uncharacterized protein YjbI with pentapeptide repeats
MKKLLILLFSLISFIGTSYAGDLETNISKLINTNYCEDCDLSEANLSGTDFSGANLSGATLNGADLSKADLSKADLSKANLLKINFRRANLSGTNFRGADLSNADLSNADLTKADLSNADFSKADLSKADLSGSYLYGANLNGANLNGANLSGANLKGVDLIKVNFTGATVSQKILEEKLKKDKEKRVAEEKKSEEKRIEDVKKEERSIENYTKNLKRLSKKLQDLELDSEKVEVDELISEVESNTGSDLNQLRVLTKTLRDMNSSVELKIKTEESKQRTLSLKDYPGFRDLKPGLHFEDVQEFCALRNRTWVNCYGIDNIKFKGSFGYDNTLSELVLDMGPIVETGGYLSIFGEGDSNIFVKMKNTFDKKYTLDYGYSERDRQLFNESEKSRLYRVYSKGQVVLEIGRKEKDWSSDLWLYIHYFDDETSEKKLEIYRPVRASDDDF